MHKPANENGTSSVATAAKGSTALTSLAALETALSNVDTGIGHSTKPMLLYKSRSNAWTYGRQQTEPEEGSRWGVNPHTFERGYVAFNGKLRLGERMRSVSLPKIDPTELPDVGASWQEQMSVEMKCLDGADANVEVVHKANTDGGLSAIRELIDQIRDRITSRQYGDNVVPIVRLDKGGYDHRQYGWTNTPLFTVVEWMSLSGPPPVSEPASPPPPPEQPRRRRVA
jgi:hypothetical protein